MKSLWGHYLANLPSWGGEPPATWERAGKLHVTLYREDTTDPAGWNGATCGFVAEAVPRLTGEVAYHMRVRGTYYEDQERVTLPFMRETQWASEEEVRDPSWAIAALRECTAEAERRWPGVRR